MIYAIPVSDMLGAGGIGGTGLRSTSPLGRFVGSCGILAYETIIRRHTHIGRIGVLCAGCIVPHVGVGIGPKEVMQRI